MSRAVLIFGAQDGLGLALARRYARHMMPQDALVLIAPPSDDFADAVVEVRALARGRIFRMAVGRDPAVGPAVLCEGLAQAGVVARCLVVPVVAKAGLPKEVAALVRQCHVPQVALIGEAVTAQCLAAKLREQLSAEAVDIHALCAQACAAQLPALLPPVTQECARMRMADVVAMMSSPLGRHLWRRNLVARR